MITRHQHSRDLQKAAAGAQLLQKTMRNLSRSHSSCIDCCLCIGYSNRTTLWRHTYVLVSLVTIVEITTVKEAVAARQMRLVVLRAAATTITIMLLWPVVACNEWSLWRKNSWRCMQQRRRECLTISKRFAVSVLLLVTALRLEFFICSSQLSVAHEELYLFALCSLSSRRHRARWQRMKSSLSCRYNGVCCMLYAPLGSAAVRSPDSLTSCRTLTHLILIYMINFSEKNYCILD